MTSRSSRALRATSDALLNDAQRLTALEERKRHLAADDPMRVAASEEIEALARRVASHAAAETALTSRIAEADADDEPPIAATPRDIPSILADWRAVERDAAGAAPGSAERAAAERRSAELAGEHRDALREEMGRP